MYNNGKDNRLFDIYGPSDKLTFAYYIDIGFQRHKDKPNNQPGTRSFYTLLIYLNEDFEDGKTIYYLDNNTKIIKPKTGMAVLFDISIPHSVEKVMGEKWIIGAKIQYTLRIKSK